METSKLLQFLHTVEELKKLERWRGQFFWKEYPRRERYESVADHSWRMAIMLAVIVDHLSQSLDLAKAMKMALIHDLPEIIVGDPSPLGSDGTGKDSHAYNKDVAEQKFQKEKEAAQKIFGELPKEQGAELFGLWLEFEAQASFEAKVVVAIDKLEGKLQASEYLNGVMFKEHQHFNLTYRAELFDADPAVKELSDLILSEFTENFKEFVPESK